MTLRTKVANYAWAALGLVFFAGDLLLQTAKGLWVLREHNRKYGV